MKLRFSRTGCSGLLAAVAFLGVPKCAFAEERWLKLTSANFELFTTEKEKAAKEALLYFEQVRSFFLQATHSTEELLFPYESSPSARKRNFCPSVPTNLSKLITRVDGSGITSSCSTSGWNRSPLWSTSTCTC